MLPWRQASGALRQVNTSPASGTECKPYPKTQTVCGLCGILSDSSYPTDAFVV
jgi:hypothetical protein